MPAPLLIAPRPEPTTQNGSAEAGPKRGLDDEQIRMLHHLKRLLDEEGDEGDKGKLKTVVKNVLKRKSKVGTVVTELDMRPMLQKMAIGHFRAGRYQASRSALALLKDEVN